ncbi:MAG TPA: hypothetical protein VG498_23075 [Terriglobales bacterium]|nr:hypothetical protein [Terriglobales bacterium]
MKNFSFNSTSTDNARNAVTRIRPSGKAVIAPFAALLIAAGALGTSGCSKAKNNQVASAGSQSQIAPSQTLPTAATPIATPIAGTQSEVPKKNSVKGPVKRLTVRTYKDADSGLSFAYPRKATLEVHDKAQRTSASNERLPMSYVGPGGTTVAVVQLPVTGDAAFGDLFLLNINKELTAEKCSQFQVESKAKGEESSEIAANQMPALTQGSKMMVHGVEYSVLDQTADGGAVRYYHRFVPEVSGDKGVCYEFGMFVNGQPEQGLENASTAEHKDLFSKLEKILASVKINLAEKKPGGEAAKADSSTKDAVAEQPTETAKAVSKDESPR